MNQYRNGRLICWEGDPDETRPGCGGCRHSAIQGDGYDRRCQARYTRFHYGTEARDREMREAFKKFMSTPHRDVDSVILGLADIYELQPETVREIVRES